MSSCERLMPACNTMMQFLSASNQKFVGSWQWEKEAVQELDVDSAYEATNTLVPLHEFSQTLQHKKLPCIAMMSRPNQHEKKLFSVKKWSSKFNVVGYRSRFDFWRVPSSGRECEGEVGSTTCFLLFSFSFVWLHTAFRMKLEYISSGSAEEGREISWETVFSFSRIIAYAHSNAETFIELPWS